MASGEDEDASADAEISGNGMTITEIRTFFMQAGLLPEEAPVSFEARRKETGR
jgi:hypothetical protein